MAGSGVVNATPLDATAPLPNQTDGRVNPVVILLPGWTLAHAPRTFRSVPAVAIIVASVSVIVSETRSLGAQVCE